MAGQILGYSDLTQSGAQRKRPQAHGLAAFFFDLIGSEQAEQLQRDDEQDHRQNRAQAHLR